MVAVLTAAAFLTASCGSSKQVSGSAAPPESVSSTSTTDLAGAPAVPSAGCTAAPATAADLQERTVKVGDVDRAYLLTMPAGTTAPTPLPLVVDIHGMAEGADVHVKMSGFAALGKAEGFITVFPRGPGPLPHWTVGPGGSSSGPNADIDFIGALLDQIEATACIDVSRVYVSGLSMGAMMSSLLACRMADRFAAIAPVAGITNFDDCTPAAPMPIIAFHGTADPILGFNGGVGDIASVLGGGESNPAAPSTTLPAADLEGAGYPANVRAWAKRNGCQPTPTDTSVAKDVTLRTYTCPPGADLEFYVIIGGGHAWPGSEFSQQVASAVGFTTMDIDATALIWEFFRRFTRRPS